MEWSLIDTERKEKEYRATSEDGLILLIRDRGAGMGQRRYACQVSSQSGHIYRYVDLIDDLERAKDWAKGAAKSAAVQVAEERLQAAAPDMLEALKAFVEAHEKSGQLEKTDTALRLARLAIEKVEQPQ